MVNTIIETVPSESLIFGWLQVPTDTPIRLRPVERRENAKGVIIWCPGASCPPANTSVVYVSTDPRLSTDRSSPFCGIPCDPNGTTSLPITNPGDIWCLASEADQWLFWMAI